MAEAKPMQAILRRLLDRLDAIAEQHGEVGDTAVRDAVPGANLGMWVESFEPNRWILVRDKKGEAIWAWQLYLLGEGRTRLITRLWMRDAWASPMIIYCLLQDVGDI